MAKSQKSIVYDSWFAEILAVVTSLWSLLAIFILLGFYNGKVLFHWHFITINSTVSALATLGRSTTAFSLSSFLGQFKWIWVTERLRPLSEFNLISEVSRGSWGGSRLLLRTKGWYGSS